jgi:hypothetical protein
LRKQAKTDMMNTSRENSNGTEKLTHTAGQQGFLCEGFGSSDRPSLSYEPVISPVGDNAIQKAFDILFQEVMRIRKSKKHEINRHIRQGFDRPAGRGTNR